MIDSIVIKESYFGDGSTTQFPFSFPFIDASDIKVTIHDIDTGEETTLTSDYYVDTINSKVLYPGYPPGEAPPLSEQPGPLPVGQKLIVYRSTPISQLKDLGDKYPLPIIEEMVDKVTLILQELAEKLSRAVIVEIGSDTTPDQLLQAIADSVKKAKAWAEGTDAEVTEIGGTHSSEGWSNVSKKWAEGSDADVSPLGGTHSAKGWAEESETQAGNAAGSATDAATSKDHAQIWAEGTDAQVTELGGTHSAKVWAQTAAKVYYVDTMAAMRADSSLTPGMVVMTKGYYAANDGGAATYNIRASESGDVDDGGSIIVLDNGNIAELITDGTVNVKQFGAKGDGTTDDTTTIMTAVAKIYAKYNGGIIYFPQGTYKVTTLNLRQYRDITIAGAGADCTKILATGSGQYAVDVKYFGEFGRFSMRDICIGGASGEYTSKGLSLRLVANVTFENLRFEYLDQCIRAGGTEAVNFNNIVLTEFNLGIRGPIASEYTEMEIDSSVSFADCCFTGLFFDDGNSTSTNSIAVDDHALNSNKFQSCIFFGEHLRGLALNNSYGGNTFIGCRFERMAAGVSWLALGSYNSFYDCYVYTDGTHWSFPDYCIDIYGVGNYIDGVSPETPRRIIRLRNTSSNNTVTWKPSYSSTWIKNGTYITPVIDFGTNNKVIIGNRDYLVNRTDSYSDGRVTNMLPGSLDQTCWTLDGVTKTDESSLNPAGRGVLGRYGHVFGFSAPTGNQRFYATFSVTFKYWYVFSAFVAIPDSSALTAFDIIAGRSLDNTYEVVFDQVDNLWFRVSIVYYADDNGTAYFGFKLPSSVGTHGLLVAMPQLLEISASQNIIIGGYVPTMSAYRDETSPHYSQNVLLDSPPNAGRHYQGDFVGKFDKVEAGTAGSKYVVVGWDSLTNSADNNLGTDWVERRVLTGN